MRSIAWIVLAVAAYGLLHSWLASTRVKAWVRARLGESAAAGYRLFFNLVGGITLLPVLALTRFLPDQPLYQIPSPANLLFLLLQLCGAGIAALGVLQTGALDFLGLNVLLKRDSTEPAGLVTTGLYRFVRHPLYSGSLLFLWFNPSMSLNLLALNLGASLYLLVGSWFEERKLLREFGETYAEYRRRTPALIPGWMK
jgi:methanethiol S-methyltransferase